MSLMQKEIYEFGPFSLDPSERVVSRDGSPLPLTPKVFDTLLCLVRNRGRLLTKDELLREIWPDAFVEEVNLAVNVSTLRKVFGEGPQDGRYIVTVPGRGYRFVADVREIPTPRENGRGLEDTSELAPVQLDSYGSRVGGSARTNGADRHVVTPATPGRSRRTKLSVAILSILVLAAVFAVYYQIDGSRTTAVATRDVSIAVLPFASLSPGKDQEYFSDGLTEELINDLAKVPSMRVIARSSSFQFKGKNEDLRVVGQKLGVANILEGSVRREGNRVRIMAELIKADDGFQLWSATYDRKIEDVFNVQDEIARATTEALQVKLVGTTAGGVSPIGRTPKSEAYQASAGAGFLR